MSRRRGDTGAGTVLVALVAALLGAATLVVATATAAVAARHRLATVADEVALAGATAATLDPRRACPTAAEVARLGRARLTTCTVAGAVVTVTVTGRRSGIHRWLTPPSLNSRAGPAETFSNETGQPGGAS